MVVFAFCKKTIKKPKITNFGDFFGPKMALKGHFDFGYTVGQFVRIGLRLVEFARSVNSMLPTVAQGDACSASP